MPPLGHTFNVAADAYDDFMGRYSRELASGLCDAAGITAGMRALDVGSGPGALTGELVNRLGAENVVAVEPSAPFAAACRKRNPGVEVLEGGGEELPFDDDSFDAALSQLVLNFLGDPLGCLREKARVTRPGGTVAACVWDYAGEMTLLRAFWESAVALDPAARGGDEGVRMNPRNRDQLNALFRDARLDDVETGELRVAAAYDDFDELWEPLCAGVGPAGAYCKGLDADRQAALRDELHRRLGAPAGSFELEARAWWARGLSAGR